MHDNASQSVRTGIILLSISVGWSGFVSLWMIFSAGSYASLMLGLPGAYGIQAAVISAVGFVMAIFLPVYAWLLVKLSHGRQWARITLTVLVLLDILHTLSQQAQGMPGTTRIVGLANLALLIIGISMVWMRNDAPHFERQPIPRNRLTTGSPTTDGSARDVSDSR